MTEISRPHQDGVGDGGPYSAADWHLILETVGLGQGANVGVVPGILNELAVTSTGDNNITVDTGRALVEGVVYENDASESKTTNDPGGAGTTGRRAVLRLDVSARTVRIAIITSADDVTTLPALTQSAGVTWEIPLAGFQIAPSGAITALTDEREWTISAIAAGRFLSRVASTRWTRPGWKAAAQASGNVASDVIIFTPILIQEPRTFDRIGVEVTTLAAGELTRLGIYNARIDPAGLTPSSLILEDTVSVATTGDKEITISQKLEPGWYFLAQVVESATPDFRTLTGAAVMGAPVTGRAATVGAIPNDGVLLGTAADAGADYPNNGFPDPAIAVTAYVALTQACVQLRDSS